MLRCWARRRAFSGRCTGAPARSYTRPRWLSIHASRPPLLKVVANRRPGRAAGGAVLRVDARPEHRRRQGFFCDASCLQTGPGVVNFPQSAGRSPVFITVRVAGIEPVVVCVPAKDRLSATIRPAPSRSHSVSTPHASALPVGEVAPYSIRVRPLPAPSGFRRRAASPLGLEVRRGGGHFDIGDHDVRAEGVDGPSLRCSRSCRRTRYRPRRQPPGPRTGWSCRNRQPAFP